jgi:hypothetical protein
MRWTWRKPSDPCIGSGERRTVTRGREVVPQTPMVAAVDCRRLDLAGTRQHRHRSSIAMELTA